MELFEVVGELSYDPSTDALLLATCGHEDLLGYFANTSCGPCAVANHRRVAGR